MRTFPLQLDDEFHREIKHAAVDAGISLHAWIVQAVKEKLNDGNREATAIGGRADGNRRKWRAPKKKEPGR